MSAIYLKQTIKSLVKSALQANYSSDLSVEVERYSYSAILGTMSSIDYAVPLFGYARELKKSPQSISKNIEEHIKKEIACETEFVNGYLNICIDDKYLTDAILSHTESRPSQLIADRKQAVIVRTSDTPASDTTSMLIAECLNHIGANVEIIDPFPKNITSTGQLIVESDSKIVERLSQIEGLVADKDSKAMYLQIGEETHALRSAKGGWHPGALILDKVIKYSSKQDKVFLIGNSDRNVLARNVIKSVNSLDVDVHAKHIDDTFKRSIRQLAQKSKDMFTAVKISDLDLARRKELLYVLDFDYDIAEAYDSGDLKRLVGEISTIMRQHPLPDVSGN